MGFTKIKTKEGKEISFTTQQYQVGLYVIINNDPSMQMTSNLSDDNYHKKIVKQAKKNGDEIIVSSVNH